ncbi:hypothetical protein GCM10010218_05510 [Streptomyces mashuensis]|uniref:Uncharacterized protein n=1 Tax=Streptomyces mashuensis TaxID=33904 RepID=A0A919E9I9_9ACTN|nr:hypothetical protein GCM10010218_05510 [Streptomyces mashuensis]
MGVDAPQGVVFALGYVAEADPVVGRGEVDVAEVVVVQGPAQVAQGLKSQVADGSGAGEVARGNEVLLVRVLEGRRGDCVPPEMCGAPLGARRGAALRHGTGIGVPVPCC